MAYARYLIRNPSGCYYFRYVVPDSFRHRFPRMQREVRRSLKTHSAKLASREARLLWAGIEQQILRMSQIMDFFAKLDLIEQQAMTGMKTPNEKELLQQTVAKIRERMTLLKESQYISDLDLRWHSSAGLKELIALQGKYAVLEVEAEKILQSEQDAMMLETVLARKRDERGISSAPEAVITSSSPPYASPSPKERISEVAERYCNELFAGGNWQEKTLDENRAIFQILAASLDDKFFADITYADMRDHKARLTNLPRNHTKKSQTRSLSLHDVLGQTNADTISTTTINKHISRLGALFTWAKKQGYCSENYAEGMKIKQAQKPSGERDAFTTDDLKRIFGTQVYTGGRIKHDYYFWLPLLGFFTGARLGELAQLQVADVYQKGDIWVLDINDEGEGRRLKTRYSNRLVPIHDELIRIGFLRFYEAQVAKKCDRLFPALKNENLGPSHVASKWFQRYKKSLGFPADGKKSFHSFRHTFANSMKQAGISESHAAAVLGHQNDGITYDRYGKEYEISKLKGVVDQLGFDRGIFVDISWSRV